MLDTTVSGLRPDRPSRLTSVARGLALFVGGFTLVGVIAGLRSPGFDMNVWWIDLRWLPAVLANLVLAVSSVIFIAFGSLMPRSVWRSLATCAVAVLLAVVALVNVITFYVDWSRHQFHAAMPVPLSLLFAFLLAFVAWRALLPGAATASSPAGDSHQVSDLRQTGDSHQVTDLRSASDLHQASDLHPVRRIRLARVFSRPARRVWLPISVTVALCLLLFPLAQVFFFGTTDYRRHADAAVVFGAEVHNDGRPSTALRDRVVTAAGLYKAGLVANLIMSGGVGANGYDEATVMRTVAEQHGVPAAAILVDSHGIDTQASVADTKVMAADHGFKHLIAVSHFYHLARIKLAYARAGLNVITVPAKESRIIPQTPRIVAREIPAFWLYYLRAVL